MLVVVAAALNSIAVLHAYFRLFTGTSHTTSICLKARWSERIAVLTLTALILGGGLMPQPGVTSRFHAATEIIVRRNVTTKEQFESHEATADTDRHNDPHVIRPGPRIAKRNPAKHVVVEQRLAQ